MSDHIPDAVQHDCTDPFDWNAYDWGGVTEMTDDWAECTKPNVLVDWTSFELDHTLHDVGVPLFDGNFRGGTQPEFSNLAELSWDSRFVDNFAESNLSELAHSPGNHNVLQAGDHDIRKDPSPQLAHHVTLYPAMTVERQSYKNTILTEKPLQQKSQPKARVSSERTDLICSYTRCARKKPFSGAWELERHVKGTHLKDKSFVCPAVGCFKKRERTAFPRPDKLTSHFHSKHDADTVVECPYEGCKAAGLVSSCDLMVVHLRHHPQGQDYGMGLIPVTGRKIQNMSEMFIKASTGLKCPLWHCNVRLGPWELLEHIKGHSLLEIQPQIDDIRRQGFSVFAMDGTLRTDGRSTTTIILNVICPVCQMVCSNCIRFFRHIFDMHVTTPNYPPLPAYAADEDHIDYHQAYATLNFITKEDTRSDLSDLIPFRRQILRLIPQCITDYRWESMWKELTWKHDPPMYSAV